VKSLSVSRISSAGDIFRRSGSLISMARDRRRFVVAAPFGFGVPAGIISPCCK
jgi:hypothetical protein